MSNCEKFRELISWEMDEPVDGHELEAHLKGCEACRAYREALRSDRDRVVAAFAELAPRQHRRSWRPAWISLSAAAVLVLLLLPFLLRPSAAQRSAIVRQGHVCYWGADNDRRDAQPGDRIPAGALVGAVLETELSLPGDAILRIREDTMLRLDKTIKIDRGEVWIETSASEVALCARGPELRAQHASVDFYVDTAQSVATVLAGTVSVGDVQLVKGDQATLGGGLRKLEDPALENTVSWFTGGSYRGGARRAGYVRSHTGYHLTTHWSLPLSMSEKFSGGLLLADGKIFAGSYGNVDRPSALYAVDVSQDTPGIAWQWPVGNVWSWPAHADGRLFVPAMRDRGHFVALNAQTGQIEWQIASNDLGRFSPLAAYGIVIFGDLAGVLSAVDAAEGTRLWERKLAPEFFFGSPSSDGLGNLFPVSTDGTLFCLEARTGRTMWQASVGPTIVSAPALGYEKIFLLQMDRDTGEGTVLAVSMSDGRPVWSHPLGPISPADVSIASGRLLIPLGERGLLCLDAGTGDALWESDEPVAGSPLVAEGAIAILAPSPDGKVLRILELSRGFLKNEIPLPRDAADFVLDSGAAFVLTESGSLIKLGWGREDTSVRIARLRRLLESPQDAHAAAVELLKVDPTAARTFHGTVRVERFTRLGLVGEIEAERYFLRTTEGLLELVGERPAVLGTRSVEPFHSLAGAEVEVRGMILPVKAPTGTGIKSSERDWNRTNDRWICVVASILKK